MPGPRDILAVFQSPVRDWFRQTFPRPTLAQKKGWASIVAGNSSLILAPTGSGKTLAAFLAAIDRVMFAPVPARSTRCRVLYISPLKALAFDVERNLRAPIAGIASTAAGFSGDFHEPTVAMRTGDTPSSERARMRRAPPDILITTPESLYLMLTSAVREILVSVDTVIVDEVHSITSSKRGAHLAVSLERLEDLRRRERKDVCPTQRIGLSATMRPLDEAARLLGGGNGAGKGAWTPRPVEIIEAGTRKEIDLCIEVPIEDMASLARPEHGEKAEKSIWPSIHPRLVAMIRSHRSTLIFVNSRRLAERLAAAINDEAGEELALAHHGSVARDRRQVIEERLKSGDLPAMVATSSMELGIDMGAIDLVIQIESPPSIASGLQRIGRANHGVGETPSGTIFPKFRGDLLACAAAASCMRRGEVEELRYPRSPLDVLAQQIVAVVAMDEIHIDDLFALVRQAAPFADLPRASFESVLDMLSGRFPSHEFPDLRPRVTWDRASGAFRAREGARRIAVSNPGTIPDRGLYGVFLAGDEGAASRRVGELDEEMVFETRIGDVFLLGASSWRVEEITHDRVLVSPAPGEPGVMPFWHGDRPARPLAFGNAIGKLARELVAVKNEDAGRRLRQRHDLERKAAENLLAYLDEQIETGGELPTDRTVVVERFLDEVGDWRVCILSPFGAAVHAPWAIAAAARLQEETGLRAETVWSDDGLVFRLPETGEPPAVHLLILEPDEVEDMVMRQLGSTALFAARFRENAARALLLPRHRPGRRQPLWIQRKRAADLLSVAARFSNFPMILETYRECLADVFDLPGLTEVLRRIKSRRVRVAHVESRKPSTFASSLLFSYVSNFIYDTDAPLAERRAQTLAIDHSQLRELLGEAELRELLDAEVIENVHRSLQRLGDDRKIHSADALHDLLLSLGDLTAKEIRERSAAPRSAGVWIEALERDQRIFRFRVGRGERLAAIEDASRYRDAFDVALPAGLPSALLESVGDPLGDLLRRYARTRGPFTIEQARKRFAIPAAQAQLILEQLEQSGHIVSGAFLPGGSTPEWCDVEVLRRLKRASLARLRAEVEPVEPAALARLYAEWQWVRSPRRGLDGLRAVIDQLQGCPLVVSTLESAVLPARLRDHEPTHLDELCTSGEVLWRGIEPLGPRDGRIAFYLRDQYELLAPSPGDIEGELAMSIRGYLDAHGASFFGTMAREIGGFRREILDALWGLVWAGLVTNDTLAPLRTLLGSREADRARGRARSNRRPAGSPPGSEGRWSLLPAARVLEEAHSATERRTALVRALLGRHGVLTREAVRAEGIEGGFSSVYEVLKAMEEAGRVRRGYFVAGLGATQFAVGGADDRLRGLRTASENPDVLVLSATDPANPFGAVVPWPPREGERLERRAGAHVFLADGEVVAYLGRSERNLLTFLPDDEPARAQVARTLARALAELVESGQRRAFFIERVDGVTPATSALGSFLESEGFRPGTSGYLKPARES